MSNPDLSEASKEKANRTSDLGPLRHVILWCVGLILALRIKILVGYTIFEYSGESRQYIDVPSSVIPVAMHEILNGFSIFIHSVFLLVVGGASISLLRKLVLPMRERVMLGAVVAVCLCEMGAMLIYLFWYSSTALITLYLLEVSLCTGVLLMAIFGARINADSIDETE
ncbi:MAG: hypothetical protein K1Y02_19750 [Candidatus Hydrogenedentes bacterium]|nr:hypothetical protein [Candidatus Hydrogenedentota bacterium]